MSNIKFEPVPKTRSGAPGFAFSVAGTRLIEIHGDSGLTAVANDDPRAWEAARDAGGGLYLIALALQELHQRRSGTYRAE